MIIGITLGIVSLGLYLVSFLMYIDYEYELYNGDITITKVYNASRRKIAQRINRDQVEEYTLQDGKMHLKKVSQHIIILN